jgi:hypothetical protein
MQGTLNLFTIDGLLKVYTVIVWWETNVNQWILLTRLNLPWMIVKVLSDDLGPCEFYVFVVLSNRPVVSWLSGDDQTNTFVLPICVKHWGKLFGDLNWRKTWCEIRNWNYFNPSQDCHEMLVSLWAFGPPTTLGRAFLDGPGVLHGFSVRRPYQVVLEECCGVIVQLACWVVFAIYVYIKRSPNSTTDHVEHRLYLRFAHPSTRCRLMTPMSLFSCKQ